MKNIITKISFGLLLIPFSINAFGQTDANTPYKGICIYIDYPDVPISVGTIQLDSLINGITYQEPTVKRSFRKYWHEQTKRNVDIQHDVFFYTAPLPTSHYDTLSWQNGILLWKDALEWVISNNPTYNWSSLSLNDRGGILSVMIISSSLDPAGVGAAHGRNWTLSNGVKISKIYGSVLQAPWDSDLNMFMTLHEGGHGIFGLPDTYDTGGGSKGVSFYSLMSGGKPEVEPLGGPFLVLNNWGHIIEPTTGTHTITLRADGDSVVVFRNPHDSLEFFTIEARKKTTLGNVRFPANLGLLLWHSDSKVSTSNTLEDMLPMRHYKHSIEQADGLFELENNTSGGNIGDLFLPGTSFSNMTIPNSNWWEGEESYFELNNIQLIGTDYIQFSVTIPQIHLDHYPEISQSTWSVVSETPAKTGFDATKAFDNDLTTYYHVPGGNTEPRPHEVVLDLGVEYTINEFYYTANKNDVSPWEGRIQDYKLYISNNINNWGVEVKAGTFFKTGIKQYILFPETSGRYVKFSAMNSFKSDPRTSIAEINLRGGLPTSLLDVSDNNFEGGYKIYPTPANDVLNIEFPNPENTVLEIYTSNLKLILSESINKSKKLDISTLANGMYILKLKSLDKCETFKFLKH